MKKKLALLLSVLMLAALVAACGGTPSTPPSTNQPGTTDPTPSTPTPSTPGTTDPAPSTSTKDSITLSINLAMTTLDVHDNTNLQDTLVLKQVYEGFFNLNELTGELEPRVAESVDISDDGLEYTFHIQPNGVFHNGDPITAEDCKFSYDRARNSPKVMQYVGPYTEIEVIDEKTVKFYFDEPYSPFLSNAGRVHILSQKDVEAGGATYGTVPNKSGTGPYYFTDYDPSTKWTLKAFDDYYRGEPKIKTINYLSITDASAGLIAFESGELDWYIAPIANWSALESDPKYATEMMPASHITYVAINWMSGVLGDDNIRKAIAHSMDRESMSIAAFDGHAPVSDFMENPKLTHAPNKDSEHVAYEYSPEKAKEYLTAAGYPDGLDIGQVQCFPGSHFEKCAQVFNSNLEEVRIKNTLILVDQAQALVNQRAQDYNIAVTGGNYGDDYDVYRNKVHSGAVGAYFVKFEGDKFDYKHFDELFERGAQAVGDEARKEIYTELNNAVQETACLLPIFNKVSPYVWNADLHVVNYPNYYFVYDWYWK